jgi:flagellar biosynthetic protein FliR
MPWPLFESYTLLPAFMLVLARMAGLMMAAPVFSSTLIPMRAKVLLTLAMSMAVFPMVSAHMTVPVTLVSAASGMVGELMIGLFIGFGASLLFLAVQVAGQVMGQQAGLALGAVFNPVMDSSMTAGAQLFFFVALMVFVGVGGHRDLVEALLQSFQTIPPLGFRLSEDLTALIVELLGLSFMWAIRIAGPVMLALVVTLVALGFIGRSVPQLNILTVGFPLKAGVGVLVMALSIVSLEPVLMDGWAACMDAVRVGLGLTPIGT